MLPEVLWRVGGRGSHVRSRCANPPSGLGPRAFTELCSRSYSSSASNPCDACTATTTSSTNRSCTQRPKAIPSGSRGAAGRCGRGSCTFDFSDGLISLDFSDGLISRESAWIDRAAVQQQLRLTPFEAPPCWREEDASVIDCEWATPINRDGVCPLRPQWRSSLSLNALGQATP